MKSLYSIISVAFIGLFLMACGDDSKDYVSPAKLQIKSAELVFTPAGGTNVITTAAQGALSATTTSNWLKLEVDGSTVKLTAEPNVDLQTRAAVINLSADGANASVTAQQRGMILDLDAQDVYAFEYANNEVATIMNYGNVDFASETSADWIHFNKNNDNYTISVDDNDGEYRKGTVTLKFASIQKTIKVQQWGKSYPFTEMNTATFTDGEGHVQTKAVTIVADASKEGAYLIKGLTAEGDIQMLTNSSVGGEFFIPAGYKVGTLVEDEKTMTLRCLISAKTKSGDRYYPTITSSSESSPYRMAFRWTADDNDNFSLGYVRNANLTSAYETDGVVVCKYNSASGAAAINRKGIVYYFTNIRFSKQ